ncbi:MAG: DUF2461 domain-containing protein [Bacteroidaceae bacterium]|nr:DUF2461 domain-containing protein [Bacteroidaceae bacterium]
MTPPYNVPLIFRFLSDVAANNNRPWFQDHRDRYDEARQLFETIAADLIVRLGQMDESLAHLTVKDCTYRFYRDTRFSPDKSPYKRHFGVYVNARGKKSEHGGYYLHLEPGSCLVASGCYWLPTKILNVLRHTIIEQEESFTQMVEAPAFRELYPSITFDPLKTLPAGLPRDFAHPEYLKCRNYCVTHHLSDSFFSRKNWMDEVLRQFSVAQPFVDFVNDVVDDYIL